MSLYQGDEPSIRCYYLKKRSEVRIIVESGLPRVVKTREWGQDQVVS